MTFTDTPQCGSDGVYRLGAWIRDSMAGIGTLTYYDPQTASYGALGHGITDMDTAQLMSLSSGSIMETTVKAVKKGLKGEPGELRGDFTVQRDVGTLTANTNGGIFGKVADAGFIDETQAIPVAAAWEVKCGPATILATVNGSDTREYQVEILRLYGSDHDTRNLMLKVTDPQLLACGHCPAWATIRLRRSVRSHTRNPVPHSTAMSFGCFPAFTISIRPSIRLPEGGRSLRWPIR